MTGSTQQRSVSLAAAARALLLFAAGFACSTSLTSSRFFQAGSPLAFDGIRNGPPSKEAVVNSVNRTETTTIPNVIWQTYRTRPLPEGKPRQTQETWKSLNKGEWDVRLWNDTEIDAFVEDILPNYLPHFQKLPLAVMRADVWRVLILAERGGLYADADVQCEKPLRLWLPSDCQVVLGLDWHTDDYFENFFLGSTPHHPLMQYVASFLVNMTTVVNGTLDVSNPHVVHETTGPAALTEGILSFLGIDVDVRGSDGQKPSERAVRLSALMRGVPLMSVARLRHGICLFGKMFLGNVVGNHGGSQHGEFLKTGWTDWRKEREQMAAGQHR